jgi:hypothetical protein
MARPEDFGTLGHRLSEWARVRLLRRPGRWISIGQDDGFHIIPLYDRVGHDPDNCVCGPTTDAVPRADGSMGWVIVHHSLDGREQHE